MIFVMNCLRVVDDLRNWRYKYFAVSTRARTGEQSDCRHVNARRIGRPHSRRARMSTAAGRAAPSAQAGADGVSRRDIAALVYNYLRSNGFAKVRPRAAALVARPSPPRVPTTLFEKQRSARSQPARPDPRPDDPTLPPHDPSPAPPFPTSRRRRSSSGRTRIPSSRPSATASPPASSDSSTSSASTSPHERATPRGARRWKPTRSRGGCTSS